MPNEVGKALEGASLESFRVDSIGRVVLNDAALAAKIRELGPPGGIDEVAGNGLCCGNGQCLSDELVAMLNKVVANRRGIG